MRSIEGPEPVVTDDRTARARIRDAAIVRFAADGVARTSVRAVAAAAEVSPGLVMHHFGSKDGLRVACDRHVAAQVRERKAAALRAGPALDVLGAFRADDGPPLLAYLAATLTEPSDQVADLVAELVDDAETNLALAVETGVAHPSDHARERAVVLTVWSLGALVLHDQLRRLLGDDLLAGDEVPRGYLRGATELLSTGVLTDEVAARVAAAVDEASAPPREER